MNHNQDKENSSMIQLSTFTRLPRLAACASFAALAISSSLFIAPVLAQTPAAKSGAAMPGDMKPGAMDMPTMMKDMNEKMSSMQPSGNTDVDFATMMRIHHQSAVTMAEAQLRDGKNPQMRAMAKKIIASQKKEIAEFDRFLAKQTSPHHTMKK